MTYIGRFAPSPSGALHFGSLVAALGSYLQARANQGLWLVRIEDIDPPREVPGAADEILRTLESFGLHWDRTVLYQHTRHAAYQAQIDAWLASGEAYFCQCTRKQIQAVGGYYQGQCRHANHGAENSAVRLQLSQPVTEFDDLKHGTLTIPKALATEDFIIKRRDGLFAYNLAVVLDDIEQGITEVVRGADLIEPTGRQISLYRQLNIAPVRYLHLPLALNQLGNKLSKQNHAPAVERHNPVPALVEALAFLNHPVPHAMQGAGIQELLNWAVAHWQVSRLPNTTALITSF